MSQSVSNHVVPPVIDIVAAKNSDAQAAKRERDIDEELAQSFPASDPPGWTMGVSEPRAWSA